MKEQLKELIDIEKENLKFCQLFFLPTGSGLIALVFLYEQADPVVVVLLALVGHYFSGFLIFTENEDCQGY